MKFHSAPRLVLAGCWLLASLAGTVRAEEAEGEAVRTAPFGFRALEIYRVSGDSVSLRVADVDGDGLRDLVYAHNADTSIRVLLQRTAVERRRAAERSGGDTAEATRRLNQIRSDDRFETVKIYTEKRIFSVQVGDLDGDGRKDLAYYGDPRELVVLYQGNEWGGRKARVAIDDGAPAADALRLADLDADGRLDIVLLGRGKTYVIYQRAGGTLEAPQVFYNSFETATGIDVVDLDADGAPDLVTRLGQTEHPLRVRFQRHSTFAPEQRFEMPAIVGALFTDLDGDGHPDFLSIQGQTRRVIAYRWGEVASPATIRLREPLLLPYRPGGSPAARRLAVGDINDDGRVDILVSYGDTAEAEVSLQGAEGDLGRPARSPTLSDVRGVAIGDFHRDEGPEVVVVSAEEMALGISRWLEVGRLSIPQTVSLAAEPLVLDRYRLRAGAPAPAESAVRGDGERSDTADGEGDGDRDTGSEGESDGFGEGVGYGSLDGLLLLSAGASGKPYVLEILDFTDGELSTRCLARVEIEARARPNGVRTADLDGDGRDDVIVFIPYENPRVYLVRESAGDGADLEFREISSDQEFGIGQLAKLSPQALTFARFPGPGDAADRSDESPGRPVSSPGLDLVVASKSHARALRVDEQGRLRILEQFPGRGATANIQGAVAVDLDRDDDLEVLLFDGSTSAVDVLDRGPRGVYRRVRTLDLPGFSFEGFVRADFNGDARSDVAVLAQSGIAILLQGEETRGLVEFAEFDPGEEAHGPREQYGSPRQLLSGDLNGDGVPDVAFSTDAEYYFTILRPDEPGPATGRLVPALRFPIFDVKSYMRGGQDYGPRQLLAADVDGDALEDVLILIHDRILLYLQDGAPTLTPSAGEGQPSTP